MTRRESILKEIEAHRHTIRALEARLSTASEALTDWLYDQIDREEAQIRALELELTKL